MKLRALIIDWEFAHFTLNIGIKKAKNLIFGEPYWNKSPYGEESVQTEIQELLKKVKRKSKIKRRIVSNIPGSKNYGQFRSTVKLKNLMNLSLIPI